jgi:hypothetical protein
VIPPSGEFAREILPVQASSPVAEEDRHASASTQSHASRGVLKSRLRITNANHQRQSRKTKEVTFFRLR